MKLISLSSLFCLSLVLASCAEGPWNNPYSRSADGQNIYYSSFDERPKYLDPARSYSSNEWGFISQIYEPPLQYHFLKRPYELIPQTALQMPDIQYLDKNFQRVKSTSDKLAFTDYIITLRPDISYQPHPALAVDTNGKPVYTKDWPGLANVYTLSDFAETGSRELVADDYIYQIKRLAFSPLHSPIASLMGDYIEGFNEFSKTLDEANDQLKKESEEENPWLDLRQYHFEGVKKLGKYSYRIRLKTNYPQFQYWLAMNFFAPLPWEADRFHHYPGLNERNITLNWYPIGTGPYYLAENNPNLRMVLKRNPNFRGERYPVEGAVDDREQGMLDDAGQKMPFIDRAVYSLDKESIPRWNKFLQGYYDLSGIGSDSFDQAVQFGSAGDVQLTDSMREKGIKLQTSVSTSIFYFGFNMKDAVVGGHSERARLLRQAISIAIDYEEFISIFRNGRGKVAQGPLPPGIFGYRSEKEDHNPVAYHKQNGEAVRRSIDDAKSLLESAGYPGGRDPETGKSLILYFDTTATGPDSKALLNWYRKQFQKIGLDLVVRTSDYNRFQDKMHKGTAQLFTWGWNADYPDPENFFFLLYGPNSRVDNNGENAANYNSPEFDSLYDQMKFMPNGDERQKVIDQMINIAREDAPWVWGFYPVDYVLRHDWYKNAKPNLMANNTLKYKRVDAATRLKKRDEWNQPVTWPVIVLVVVFVLSLVPAIRVYRRHEKETGR